VGTELPVAISGVLYEVCYDIDCVCEDLTVAVGCGAKEKACRVSAYDVQKRRQEAFSIGEIDDRGGLMPAHRASSGADAWTEL
jgi:hypothetical protein